MRNVIFSVLVFLVTAALGLAAGGVTYRDAVRCRPREREALLALQKASQMSWDTKSNHHQGECCDWAGVRCDEGTGRVIAVELPNSVQPHTAAPCGSLPPSLSSLESLRVLDLRGGCFSGAIPRELGSLQNLTHLDLSGNFISQVPNLSILKGVTYLNLSYNFNGFNYDGLWDLNLSKLVGSFPNLMYLDLSLNFVLAGLIPASELSDSLPHLVYLDLSVNNFTGLIPWQLASFRNLQHLDLSKNDLHGVIPWQLASLRNLQYLDLSYNDLHGVIPEQLGSLPSLAYLDVRMNSFQNPVPWQNLGNLSNLKHLGLGGGVEALLWPEGSQPAKWAQCKWTMLESLWCYNVSFPSNDSHPFCLEDPRVTSKLKDLSFISSSGPIDPLNVLAKASSLRSLSLSQNALTKLPPWSQQLPLLETLDISYNSLKEIPSWLRQLPLFKSLDISHNLLSGTISHHGLFANSMVQLGSLDLSYNYLTGTIPPSLLQPSLSSLDLSNNLLSGGIPLSIGNLSLLTSLDLSNNSLSGVIPPLSMGNMSNTVADINLSDNNFTGTIPIEIFQNCASLMSLDLSNNKLSGSLPPGIGNCSNLHVLMVGNNSLSAEIPASIGLLNNLGFVALHNNKFIGSIPTAMKNCSSMSFLDLSYNKLSGEIPVWITGKKFPLLRALLLDNNQFQGSIPTSLPRYFTNLQILLLANNHLSGPIPNFLDHLEAMKHNPGPFVIYVIDLTIPIKNGDESFSTVGSYVTALDFSGNHLEGGIPPQIGALGGLISLNLSHNMLSGPIPSSLGNLLESLDLSNNHLTGRIPPELCSLHFLEVLNLSRNNLQGPCIPTQSCTQLSTFSESSFADNDGLCGSPLANQCLAPPAANYNHEGGDFDAQGGRPLTLLDKVRENMSLEGLGIGYALGFSLTTFFLHFFPWRIPKCCSFTFFSRHRRQCSM